MKLTPKQLISAAALVLTGMIPVGIALWLSGPVFAQAVYIGLVLMSSGVRAHPPRIQVLEGLWIAVCSMVGALVGPNPPAIVIVILFAAAGQTYFTRRSSATAAMAPSTVLYYAMFAPTDSALPVVVGSLIGVATIIAAAHLARIRPNPTPIPTSRAVRHASILAVGCVSLFLVGQAAGFGRSNWALLVFCLVLLPSGTTLRRAMEYLMGALLGATAAIALGITAPVWFKMTALLFFAVLTVAYQLERNQLWGVTALTATVILLSSFGDARATIEVGLQRGAMALIGVAAAVVADLCLRSWEKRVGEEQPENPAAT